jgi:hypothetical protein
MPRWLKIVLGIAAGLAVVIAIALWLLVDFGGELPSKDAWPTLTRR